MDDGCCDFGSVDLSSLVDGHYWVLVDANSGCQQVHVRERGYANYLVCLGAIGGLFCLLDWQQLEVKFLNL